MRQAPWHFCILIPARNEEVLLARCLTSIVKACSRLPPSVTYDIVIAVDCSTDRTLEIARSMTAAIGAVVSTQAGVVGETRALAARVALERYAGPLNRCWLANTDADCIVPQNWLLDQLSFASADLDAFAGIVEVDTFEEHDPGVSERFRSTYRLNTTVLIRMYTGQILAFERMSICESAAGEALLPRKTMICGIA